MRIRVLLNLLNVLRKMQEITYKPLSSILSLFRNKFNKLNKTGARMLDYFYHMSMINTKKNHF